MKHRPNIDQRMRLLGRKKGKYVNKKRFTLLFHPSLQFNLVGFHHFKDTTAALEMTMNIFLKLFMNQCQLLLLFCNETPNRNIKIKHHFSKFSYMYNGWPVKRRNTNKSRISPSYHINLMIRFIVHIRPKLIIGL